MSEPSNAQLIRFAKAVLSILQQPGEDDPDIRRVYEAAARCNIDTRQQSGDDD